MTILHVQNSRKGRNGILAPPPFPICLISRKYQVAAWGAPANHTMVMLRGDRVPGRGFRLIPAWSQE